MKKLTAVQIAIPEPCKQAWEDMQPVNGGRHCAHCQKVVVDFTRMTNAQLLDYFKTNGTGCGQFRSEQVDVTIRGIEVPGSNRWARLAAGIVLAAGLSGQAEAQTKKYRAPTVQKHPSKKGRQHRQHLKGVTVEAKAVCLPPIIDPEGTGPAIVRGAYEIDKVPAHHDTSCYKYPATVNSQTTVSPPLNEKAGFWQRLKKRFR